MDFTFLNLIFAAFYVIFLELVLKFALHLKLYSWASESGLTMDSLCISSGEMK